MSYYKGVEFLTERIGGKVMFYIVVDDKRVYFSTTRAVEKFISALPRKGWFTSEREISSHS